jgi:hypothetical protein
MREFITLFDAHYLPRGLVLYRSLARHLSEFRLRVLCLDAVTAGALGRLALPHLETVRLEDLEAAYPELLAVKPDRTRTEYFWTLTPACSLYALDHEPALKEITYLDADMMFFADPEPIFAELGGDSVLITPHRFSRRWAHLESLMGRYNVQFMTFRRDAHGHEVLRWWHERCIEWCFAKPENGKFGDQKYLDDWPERFEGVHVLDHPGGGLAPWNVSRYRLTTLGGGRVAVDGRELLFFHYHGLHRRKNARGRVSWQSEYPLTGTTGELVWAPYLRELETAMADARELMPDAPSSVEPFVLRDAMLRPVRRAVPSLLHGLVPAWQASLRTRRRSQG